jgi:hypothetical protein
VWWCSGIILQIARGRSRTINREALQERKERTKGFLGDLGGLGGSKGVS